MGEHTLVSSNRQYDGVEANDLFEYLFSRSDKKRLALLHSVFRDGRTYLDAGKRVRKSPERVRQILNQMVRNAIVRDRCEYLGARFLSRAEFDGDFWYSEYVKSGQYFMPSGGVFDVYRKPRSVRPCVLVRVEKKGGGW